MKGGKKLLEGRNSGNEIHFDNNSNLQIHALNTSHNIIRVSSHPSLSNFHFFYQKFFTPLGIQIFSSLQNPKETHDTPSNNYLSPHKSLLQTLSYLL